MYCCHVNIIYAWEMGFIGFHGKWDSMVTMGSETVWLSWERGLHGPQTCHVKRHYIPVKGCVTIVEKGTSTVIWG